MKLNNLISKSDAICLLEIINANLKCNSEEAFSVSVLQLQKIISFESSFCSYMFGINSFHMINVKYPNGYLDRYMEKKYFADDKALSELNKTFELQNWNDIRKKFSTDKKLHQISNEGREFGLNDGFSYGVHEKRSNAAYFTFAGIRVENTTRTKKIIEFIVPHLSVTMKRISEPEIAKKKYSLTPSEFNVLEWLKEGKSTWDIATILSISERTANFHVNNIIKKLEAMNRTHAVAKALESKLIDL